MPDRSRVGEAKSWELTNDQIAANKLFPQFAFCFPFIDSIQETAY